MLHAEVQRHMLGLVTIDRSETRQRHVIVDIFPSPAGETGQKMNVDLIPIYWPGFASPNPTNPMIAGVSFPIFTGSNSSSMASRATFG